MIFKIEDYVQNPLEVFNIRNGGLAIYGGIIGATIFRVSQILSIILCVIFSVILIYKQIKGKQENE